MHFAALLATDMKVNLLGGGLIVLGLVLLVVTISFWRSAVEDNSVLAPLEVMADRRFARANNSRRLAMLNKVRPEGAEPVTQLASPPVLSREPISEPAKAFRDPFPHDDDAVDVVPSTIDPLLGGR
jgi:hypothetical protein